jgi:MFS family permease
MASAPLVQRSRGSLRFAMGGGLSFGVFMSLSCLFPSAVPFTIVSTVGVVSTSLYWPVMQAWMGSVGDPRLRSRRIGVYNLSWTLGLATGPLLSGPAYTVHYMLPFGIVAVFAFTAVALVASLPAESPGAADDGAGDRSAGGAPAGSPADAGDEQHIWCTWAANVVAWGLLGALQAVYPKRIDDLAQSGALYWLVEGGWAVRAEAATIAFAALLFLLYVLRAGVSLLLGRVGGWRHKLWLLVLLQFLAAGACYGLSVTQSVLAMMLWAAVIGIAGGTTFFASLYYSIAHPARRHFRATVHESMTGFGRAVGALGFGQLAGLYGVAAPFRWAVALVVPLIALQFVLLVWARRRRPSV